MLKLILSIFIFVSLAFSSLVFSQVGIKYDINASNPLAVIAAMDKIYASHKRQVIVGQVTI